MSKKIAFFCDHFTVGGVERVLVNMCNMLAEQEWSVVIVWTGYVEDNFLLEQLSKKVKQIYAVELLNLESSPKPKKSFLKKKIWKFKKLIDRYKLRNIAKYIDDFYSYDFLVDFKNGEVSVCNVNSLPHQKKIVWLHGSFTLYGRYKFIKKKSILKYDRIVCLTKEFRDLFVEKYPDYKEKIINIYNPVDIDDIQNKSLQKNESIVNYAPYFLCVSRLDNDKDIETILKSCEIFYKNGLHDSKMIFLGDGHNFKKFNDYVKQKNLTDKVFFLGNSANPYPWMRNAKALIMSSKNEGLSMVLVEAQISETLCVSSNCPCGPKEVLEYGKSGILFDVGDYEKLAQIMKDIEDNKVEKSDYVTNALKAVGRFNKDNFIHDVESMLTNL